MSLGQNSQRVSKNQTRINAKSKNQRELINQSSLLLFADIMIFFNVKYNCSNL